MALLTNPVYYRNGTSGASTCIGYESSYNRVLRFSFKTGDKGATSISISIGSGTISKVDGSDQTSIPFYIGTSSSSHKNANEASGSAVTGYITGSSGSAYSGKEDVNLKANTTYYLWFFPKSKTYGFSYWHSTGDYSDTTSYSITGTSTLKLSITTDTGIKSVVVNRTSSAVGAGTGNLSNGATIYKNDKLKITFTEKDNYSIATHTVNDTDFTSGKTYTVNENVNIKLSTTPLKSIVGATDANIQATSTITITRYNDSYIHTLTYVFGELTGTIATKTTNTSIAWAIPDDFYTQVTDTNSRECTITCDTYNGDTKIGSSNCTLTISVSALMAPHVYGTVVDINEVTKALTGDDSKLIRYKSTAQCEIIPTAYGEASISSVSINGYIPIDNKCDFSNVSNNSFIFKATDSRGNSGSYTANPKIIEYVMLTCNPTVSRLTPTGSVMMLSFSGNFFNENFGSYDNQLTLQYRYKEDDTDSVYGDWNKIDDSHISKGSTTYASTKEGNFAPEAIEIDGDFDYTKSYRFEIKATDGAEGIILTEIVKEVAVPQGIPVFDWGKEDFNLNVPLLLKNINILDIIYPIGSVYMSVNENIPDTINGMGIWESIDSGINSVYAWKRIKQTTEQSVEI